VTKEGSNEFSFRVNGHKHVFQAASAAERSNWILAIETKATEGKGLKEGIVGSESYKKHFERYSMLLMFQAHYCCTPRKPLG
jgi:Pleckstrin homology domain